ncbi:MAG TPA: calcium/sodium antiporter [Sedimentisphaerales bacterium]|nr:calcium/sodium antiporter [Sedimentisphaerales bacterium]
MLTCILMAIGFALVIKGADVLVDGASALANRLNVSDLVIGLTVVAFGTSTPELFVNIFASVQGNTDIAVGNILGSNIANILLILGISSIIFPLTVTKGTVWKEIPLSLLAAVLVGIMANHKLIDSGGVSALTRTNGLVLLAFFIVFIYYSFGAAARSDSSQENIHKKQYGLAKIFLLLIIGLSCLIIGSKLIVNGAVYLATALGVSESLIGLTIVAVGTSLPELATSAVAAYKKNSQIAVGNVVGSNIFNIFFVLGISSIIRPLPLQAQSNIDIAVLIVASLLLFLWTFTGKKRVLDRWEGLIFVILYIGYIGYLITRR